MKYSLIGRNKMAQLLILASVMIVGLPGLAFAHEGDTSNQDTAVQRPVPQDRIPDNRDGSIRRDDPTRIKNPNQGPGVNRDDTKSADRQNSEWERDRSFGHDGAH